MPFIRYYIFAALLGIALGLIVFTVSSSPMFCRLTNFCLLAPPPATPPNRGCDGLREYPTPQGNVICAKNDKALTGHIYPRNWPVEGA